MSRRVLRVAVFGRLPSLCRSVEAIIRADAELDWVDAVGSVDSAVQLCESGRADVVLIDSDSDPDWKLCLMLTKLFPMVTVVGLLGDTDRSPVSASWALLHGAKGIVGVDAETERLGMAIRGAVQRGHHVDSGLAVSTARPEQKAEVRGKPLSAREYEVLLLIADGRTAEQIGHRLGIAADTVRTHVCHILRKLNARDRAHAVAVAFRRSLLPGRLPPSADGTSDFSPTKSVNDLDRP
ncbi:MAG TPA: response regulator transcription factor [Pseudonocardiaceae bacterium]|nr:response regulator transcription factor [Pseudonocardiaceae bacterium]